jgi:hypothetical protein
MAKSPETRPGATADQIARYSGRHDDEPEIPDACAAF